MRHRDRITIAAVCFSLVGLFACKKENKVYVECAGVGTGFNCTADHREGSDKVKVCWDVNVVCKNGTHATASGCATVAPSGKATTFIPVSDVKNNDKCDMAVNTAVENVKLTAAE